MAASDVLAALLRMNIAAGAAILLVIALRKPIRAAIGARLAYALWLLPVLAGAAMLTPARQVAIRLPAMSSLPAPAPVPAANFPIVEAASAAVDPQPLLLAAWAAGVVIAAIVMAWLQRRFTAEVHKGAVGPAVVGLIAPRIVTPRTFEETFTTEEQALVLAHEQAHLARQDSRLNGFSAALQCLFWFNPLIHIAAHLARIDQEMACDEAVVTRFPEARAVYARALVKAQLAIRPLPLGCYWPSGTEHPLQERIAMLKLDTFSPCRRAAGTVSLAVLGAAISVTAWAAQPARVSYTATETPAPRPAVRAEAPRPLETPARAGAAPVAPRPMESPTRAPQGAPQPQKITNPVAMDPSRPRTVEGVIARFAWTNPSSEITIRDATGQMVVVNTETADSLRDSGGSRQSIRPGMTIRATGYASVDGSRVYADPTQITSNGAPLFPKAAANRDLPESLSLRVVGCGPMPNSVMENAGGLNNDAAVAQAVKAWQADCDAQVARTRAQLALPKGGTPEKR